MDGGARDRLGGKVDSLFGLTCRRVGQYLDGVEAKKGRQQKGKGRKEKGRRPPPFLSEVNM
jgi:hypothetical protein